MKRLTEDELERIQLDITDLRNVYKDLREIGMPSRILNSVANAGMQLQKIHEHHSSMKAKIK